MASQKLHKSVTSLIDGGKYKIYGMEIDFTKGEIQYVGENKSYDPLTPATDDAMMQIGDWAKWNYFNSIRPAMCLFDGKIDYYLKEDDYTLKEDLSASDIENENYNANAMTVVPKIYTCSYNIDDKRYVYYCEEQCEGFEAIGFNVNGNIHDYMLIPMFYGSVDSSGRMRSLANVYSAGSATGNSTQNAVGSAMDATQQYVAIKKAHENALFFGGSIVSVLIDLAMMLSKSLDPRTTFGIGINKGHTNDSDYEGHWGTKKNEIKSQAFASSATGFEFGKMFHSAVISSGMLWQRDPYVVCDHGNLKVSTDYRYDITGKTYKDTKLKFTQSSYYKKIIFIEGFGAFVDPESATEQKDGYFVYANEEVISVASRFGCIRNGDKASPLMLSMNHSAFNVEDKNEEGISIAKSKELDESFSWWWNFGASLMQPAPLNKKLV